MKRWSSEHKISNSADLHLWPPKWHTTKPNIVRNTSEYKDPRNKRRRFSGEILAGGAPEMG